jgi:transposase
MRIYGIDIASEVHVVAGVDAEGELTLKPAKVEETGTGHEKLLGLLGEAAGALVVMEATGHYWKNVFARLSAAGFSVAVVNPLAIRRFAESHLKRAKTDATDALLIARFGHAMKPRPAPMLDEQLEELREAMRLRDRWVQDLGDRVRQLHRLVDLGFPEFTRHVHDLGSGLAATLLTRCPTAAAFRKVKPSTLAKLKYDGRHHVPEALATELIAAAKHSAGMHHGDVYQVGVRATCEDILVLRSRIREADRNIATLVDASELGGLLQTIDGIGPTTAARILAEFGDPSTYASADAFAAHFGVVPATNHSGKSTPLRSPTTNLGDAKLRSKLWMPTLTAVARNPWLKAFYERLIARGKPAKVALTAAMRKLTTAIYSVAKNRKPFVPRLPAPPTKTTC